MLSAAVVLLTCLVAQPSSGDTAGIDFFEKKIRPVLVQNCYKCHSARPGRGEKAPKKVKGGLSLDSRAGWMKGGDSGPAIVPGDPGASLLIQAIRHDDPDLEMPPKSKLPASVIADFVKWVKMGTPDPRGGQGTTRTAPGEPRLHDIARAKEAWPFRPPSRLPVPAVENGAWPRSEVDCFIAARLDREGLRPVGDADRRALLRRAFFALTGLPPDREEIDEFVGDSSRDAFDRVVDRLLASHQFGERWGRHWLDVARYAESSGGGRSQLVRNAWRYRDYVVDSFNSDRPYDRFVQEQIAGDLLSSSDIEERREALVATGFLALGPKNLDHQDKELLRMDVVDEQLDTIGRAFLGLTLGCARCHDHKFDPITTTEYHALAGIFRSTKTLLPGNVSGFVERPLPGTEKLVAARERYQRARKELEGRLKKARDRLQRLKAPSRKRELLGIVVDDLQAEVVGQWTRSTFHPRYVGEGYIHDGNSGKGERSVRFVPDLPRAGVYEVRLAYTPGGNRAIRVPVTVRHAGEAGKASETSLRVNQRSEPPIDGGFLSLGRFRFDRGRAGWVTVANLGTVNHVIADAAQFIPVGLLDRVQPGGTPGSRSGPAKAPAGERPGAEITEAGTRIEGLEKELRELEGKAPPPPPMAISVLEEKRPENCPLYIRGDVHKPGERVARGFPAVATAGTPPRIDPGQSGRRALARWLTGPNHPLTARVVVNRIWHHLFGNGIVRSLDNLGYRGEAPSHPELLDWLAVRFVEDGWSIKKMVRRLMLSRVYQLSSEENGAAIAADPENRLFWRMNRRRLEAEAIRDAVLAVSGQLDLRCGGATIRPGTVSEFGYVFDSRRRSIYLPVLRNRLHGLLEVFDFPDPNVVSGGRSVSTLPTQALYLMNSSFVIEASRHAARELLREPGLDDATRVDRAYLRTIGRPPGRAEREVAVRHVRDLAGGDGQQLTASGSEALEMWTGLYQALFACVDFRYCY